MNVAYDAAVLVAADRSERETWADHQARLELGLVPVTTAPVVAQVSRLGRQVQLRRLLRGCEIMPFGDGDAHAVGELAGRAGVSDVVDVHLVLVAARAKVPILTSDVDDVSQVASAVSPKVTVIAV